MLDQIYDFFIWKEDSFFLFLLSSKSFIAAIAVGANVKKQETSLAPSSKEPMNVFPVMKKTRITEAPQIIPNLKNWALHSFSVLFPG